ncbi:hypothetical protein HK097_001311 [Rhizophlyctis rosea]|uniref:Cation-transporting P-type ATPase C-terminal domain-containing protein n=1 Tax=Rhizophlyctis rosea TaxID=64517 RepID=A0AAD5WYZ9_9FUNG|nr:hypothetical protein HK097_001311 [Rhizophlyctis rosea]
MSTVDTITVTPDATVRPVDCNEQPGRASMPKLGDADLELHSLHPSPSVEISNATSPADERYLAYHHLSSDEAVRRLLATADEVLHQHKKAALTQVSLRLHILKPTIIVSILSALGLIAFYVHAVVESDPYQSRATSALVEGILLLIMVVWDIWIQRREAKLTATEMVSRIQSIIEDVRVHGINQKQDLRIPTAIPTVSVARVIRDRNIYTYPWNLLVEDDVIQLAYGDTAPCRIQYVYSHFDLAPENTAPQYFLEKGEVFTPTLFGSPPNPSILHRAVLNEGQFHFRVVETPIRSMLSAALNFKRPDTVLSKQLSVFRLLYSRFIIWIVLAVSLIINIIRYAIPAARRSETKSQGTEMLLVLQVYALLPMLPLALPTYILMARSYANAQILSLFDALQSSNTEFEDKESVDEFDAAPPPMKDLRADWRAVWSRFLDQLIKVDIKFLARTTGLVDSLANTTVICAIDREGTVASAFPSVEEVFFLKGNGDSAVLDIASHAAEPGIKFEDRDWSDHMPLLKPLGLAALLNTDCGARLGKKRTELHRKSNQLHLHGRVKSSRQSFTFDAVKGYVARKTIQTFAPYHGSVMGKAVYHFEVPSMFSQVNEEVTSGTCHLFSEGTLELVLESCADYWDGSGLGEINEDVEKKILEFYQNAILADSQVVAFAYRPIQTSAIHPSIYTKPHIPIYLELPDQQESSANGSSNDVSSSVVKTPEKNKSRPLWRKALSRIDGPLDLRGGEEKGYYQEAVKAQTFLGMASYAYQPKANMIDFIEDLGLAGIRFVYFSSAPERESKSYAERLGLEIDWNACILLSSAQGDEPGYLDEHDVKARLPRGVENIRNHIEEVDDIPLHVGLFAECSPYSTREMVKIFQEYGEVVCCIGSSLGDMGVECFAMADISIAVDPLAAVKNRNAPHTGPIAPLVIGALLGSSPCALSLHSDTSVYSLSQIIREARTLADNARQMFVFYLGCQMSLVLTYILSYCLLLPPIFSGYQVMWVMWVLMPMICLTFMVTPHAEDVMTHMPVKNMDHVRNRWRYVRYGVLRFGVSVLVCCFVFVIALSKFAGHDPWSDVFGNFGNTSWLELDGEEQWALLYAQNCALVVWVVHMALTSGTFLSRTGNLKTHPPYHNIPWIVASILSILLQCCFFAISVAGRGTLGMGVLPWWVWFVAFVVGPVILVPVHEVVKVWDREEWKKFQKRSKLEFNTKL